MPPRRNFSPDEAQRIIAEYEDSTLRDVALNHSASRDAIRRAIVQNGGAIRTAAATRYADKPAPLPDAWKYGALDGHLNRGVPFPTAVRFAHLHHLDCAVIEQRLQHWRDGRLSCASTTLLQEYLDSHIA